MYINRRDLLIGTSASALALSANLNAAESNILMRSIPSSGENIPAIGMGTWLTFDISPTGAALAQRIQVLQAFFDGGGAMIDSSPMYGQSEEVIGHCLQALKFPKQCFRATKVWTSGKEDGIRQMENSMALWQQKTFDLMQIHNLVDWPAHMETLVEWKKQGRIKYIGVTTYGGLKHDMIQRLMKKHPIDFVQVTYNILDRDIESTIAPLAKDKGIAIIANRPFQGGSLFNYVQDKQLPPWAKDIDCHNWAQFFLKYIIAHPAITCAIPATRQLGHMQENMASLKGALPDKIMRKKMHSYFEQIS